MDDMLTMESILTEDEAFSLFSDTPEEKQDTTPDEKLETKENKETTEVVEGNPFGDDEPEEETQKQPESVSSEETNTGDQEDTAQEQDESASPKFYSSIASALKEEGVFPDLDDAEVESADTPEAFVELVQKQIKAGFDEQQKRILDALNDGVQPNVVKNYENTLSYLDGISDDILSEESERGEQVRRQLLEQDFLNRGYTKERAIKMTDRLFNSGEDIEEAKNALVSNKEYFQGQYDDILKEAKTKAENAKKADIKKAEQLKKAILNDSKIFGDVEIDKATRQKIYENVSKPVYKDPETGQLYTALQKYRHENENDYYKNIGILFTLTDGFKNIDKLVQPTAKKEVKKKLRELEHTINNTQRSNTGTLKYQSTASNKSLSLFDNGFMIDLS